MRFLPTSTLVLNDLVNNWGSRGKCTKIESGAALNIVQHRNNNRNSRIHLRRLLYVFRKETLAQELILSRHVTNAYGHTDTPCGQLVELLVGKNGSTEAVVAAEHKICGGQVKVTDALTDDFLSIGGNPGKAETYGQPR